MKVKNPEAMSAEEGLEEVNRVPPPAPTDIPAAGDARDDTEKLKQNREHLRVNDEHKTPEMERGQRGTFP